MKEGTRTYSLCRFVCLLFCKLYCRLSIRGREHIPAEGGVILACNHVSNLDPIVLGVGSWRHVSFMAKRELFRVPVLGRLLRLLLVIPLNREGADRSAIKESIRRVRQGKVVALFPEGTRVGPEHVVAAKAGVGFLAQTLGVPVIPAYVSGTDAAWPRGVKFPRPYKVAITFGERIAIDANVTYAEAAELVMARIRQLSRCAILENSVLRSACSESDDAKKG